MALGNLGRMNLLITATDRASGKLDNVTNNIQSSAASMRSAGQTLTTGVTVPLVGAGAAAAKFAADFEKKSGEVQSTADLTNDEISKVEDTVQEVASTTGKSMDSVFDSMQKAVSGSLDLAESQELVAEASKASAAGFGETERLVDVSTTAFDLFRDNAESSEQILNEITNAAQNTQVNVENMAQAFSRGASTASSLGVNQNELVSTLGVVSERFGDTQRGGRAVQQMLMQLQDPSDSAAGTIQELFGSVDNLHQKMDKDFVGTLQEMQGKLKDSEAGLEDVFGSSQSLDAAQTLLKDSGERVSEVLEDQADATGSVQDAFEKSENPTRQMNKALNNVKSSLIPIGRQILPYVTAALDKVAGALEKASNWFQGLSDTGQKLVLGLGAVAAAIGPVLLGIGMIVPAISTAVGVLGTMAGIVAGISAPVLVLAGAVAALGIAYKTNFMGMKDATDSFLGSVKEALMPVLENLFNLIKTVVSVALKGIGRLVQGWGRMVQKMSGLYGSVLKPVIDSLGTNFIMTFHILKNAISFGLDLFSSFAEGAKEFLGDAADFVVSGMESMIDTILGGLNDILDAVAKAASKVPGISFEAPQLEKPNFDDMLSGLEGTVDEGNSMLEEEQLSMAEAIGGEEARSQVEALHEMTSGLDSKINGVGEAAEAAGKGIENMGTSLGEKDIDLTSSEDSPTPERAAGKTAKEQEKQRTELQKMRRLMEQQDQEGSGEGINIDKMEVKSDNPEEFEKKLRREASAAGIGGRG